MKKKVSVVIPAYNCQNVLDRCVKSIIAQDYSELEIVIVNDGSKDDTGKIADELAKMDDRIVVINKANEGVSMARNDGLKAATGHYVMFADADDYVEDNYVSSMVSRLENDNSDIVIAGYVKHQDGKQTKVNNLNWTGNKEEFSKIFYNVYNEYLINMPWNKIYKRELITQYFDKSLSLGEDLVFNIDYLKNINIISIADIAGYQYCFENGSSLAGAFREDKFDNSKMLHKKVLDFAVNDLGCDTSAVNDKVYVYEIRYSITNLCRSKLSAKDKKMYIKKWCEDSEARKQYKVTTGLGKADKLIGFFFTRKMYRTLYLILSVLL